MKLNQIIPKKLRKSRNYRSLSGSDDPSFRSSASLSESSESSNSIHKTKGGSGGSTTPRSVLPEFSDLSTGIYAELVEAFKMLDGNGEGNITKEKVVRLLSLVGAEPPSEEELGLMLSEVDRDGDGRISLEEFSAISSAFGPPSCQDELRATFDFFDADHDGKISAEELYDAFKALDGRCTLEDCQSMINGVDKNGDGFVCFEDFTRMMELQR